MVKIMKILKISLMVLVTLSPCALSAMGRDDVKYSPLENESGITAESLRETDQQRVERLAFERKEAWKKNPALDFYDHRALEAPVSKAYPAALEGENSYRDADGDLVDVVELIRNKEISEAQLKAIEEAGKQISGAVRVREGLRLIHPRKSASDVSVKMRNDINDIEKFISSALQDPETKTLLNASPEDRVQVKLLIDQEKSLSEAIDRELLEGKSRFWRRRSTENIKLIDGKLEDLKVDKREIEAIVRKLIDRAKVERMAATSARGTSYPLQHSSFDYTGRDADGDLIE
jgi:hypothetical protein